MELQSTDAGPVSFADGKSCSCGQAPQNNTPEPSVYALGRISTRWATPGIEKEFAQVASTLGSSATTAPELVRDVLLRPENRYLARKACWVFSIEGVDTYLLVPRDPFDLDRLLGALRPRPRNTDVDLIIGSLGPVAPPNLCNGLQVPIVFVEQVYTFDIDAILNAIPRPKDVPTEEFARIAEDVFARIAQLADNAGSRDEHRAINYLSVRYQAIYTLAFEQHQQRSLLKSVDVKESRLSGTRRVVDVVFKYVNVTTDVSEQYFVRVDVSEQFPFLVTKLSPYYDR